MCKKIHAPFQMPDLAALATAEANGFMGMQHTLQYGQLPPEFAGATALGVNVPVALDPSQRHPQEPLAHQMDGRVSHPGQRACTCARSCHAFACHASAMWMQRLSCRKPLLYTGVCVRS